MAEPTPDNQEPFGELLSSIESPADLRKLDVEQLPQVCRELRDYIIDVVSVHGGHFGASLGAVDLTVAAHYVYDTPRDQLVWDVGHQAYGHKMLTGRRGEFPSNRRFSGLSGFPKRSESPYDTFGVGHASTSISAAFGMAKARDLAGTDERVVAVIGDGSMTGGLAFEGLNNAGASNSDLLVVLNDNCMSIDPNVGALKEYLTDIAASEKWNTFRDEVWSLFERVKGRGGGHVQRMLSRVENGLKTALTPGGLFEALGFRYFGPVDGHDVVRLVSHLEDLRKLHGPILLHTLTVKGKGFSPAEKDQTKWHAQSAPFNKVTGVSLAVKQKKMPPKWQDVFGKTMVELAKQSENVVGITAAMPSGTSMKYMLDEIPDRAFDVGIAEMHAVVFAAGMATRGYKPFCAIYSTFLQRAYDGVVHDVALQNLPVVFCMDRAGLVGADGPTHHGGLDIAYLRCIPNLVVAAPLEEQDLRDLMYTAMVHDGPFAIRYPRGATTGMEIREGFKKLEIGKGRKIADGSDVAILSYGAIGNYVTESRQRLKEKGVSAAHYDLRFVKPIDDALLSEVARTYRYVVTVEDGVVQGGAGSAVLEWLSDNHVDDVEVLRLGLPDTFVEHGTQQELHDLIGIGPNGIVEHVMRLVPHPVRDEPVTHH